MKRFGGIGGLAGGVSGLFGLALGGWRMADRRADGVAWARLLRRRAIVPLPFDPAMVAELPDPARRYFLFSIRTGALLKTAVELELTGEIGMGNLARPNYRPMHASQILAAPEGFVWKVRAGSGLFTISGSDSYFDGQGWTRLWLAGMIPVVRAGGSQDFARSAAARAVSEALFWSPAALLPGPGVSWSEAGPNVARVTIDHRGEAYSADLTVTREGRPLSVLLQRWSRENPERQWRYQPFGGMVKDVFQVGGFTIARRIEGGNHFGTADFFPFYRAEVIEARFR